MRTSVITALVLIGLGATMFVQAQEKKLERKDLPAAVRTAVDRECGGATVKGFSTERENGIRTYEAEMMVDGHSKDISMDAAGNVLEVEEQVTFDSLPASVRTSLTNLAGSGKITKVESLTKKGKLVAYEAAVKSGTKHREFQVGPNGEKLKREE
jgi:hypothetical protein